MLWEQRNYRNREHLHDNLGSPDSPLKEKQIRIGSAVVEEKPEKVWAPIHARAEIHESLTKQSKDG